ncbi:hypothetical protein BJX64DRAFT_299545 [Aspergillus heterothallicus]
MATPTPQTRLFTPMTIGTTTLAHRVVMAPLTRFRNASNNTPLPMATEYYTQRASVPGTLIIAEATQISSRFAGMPDGPGIWSEEQIAAWREVTDAVHARGGVIFCQLIALGRAARAEVLRENGGFEVCAPSAVAMEDGGVVPRELGDGEILEAVRDFGVAASNAVRAGFDGVEVHGANGYLVDQFLQDVSNKRGDQWGGSIENRARFAVEVARAMVDAVGPERVGFRLSPWNTWQGMKMADPVGQFEYTIRKLKELDLAYLHLVESRVINNIDTVKVEGLEPFLEAWGTDKPVILAGGYNAENTVEAVDVEYAKYNVAVAFGRHFLANPDLPFRLQEKLGLNKYDRATFYTPKQAAGYLDYPFSLEFLAKA